MKTNTVSSLGKVIIFLFYLNIYVNAACYFPPEFQGEYKMQTSNYKGEIKYSSLNITANAIPIWGNCHQRIENTFMLMIKLRLWYLIFGNDADDVAHCDGKFECCNSLNDVYRGEQCIRCLHLKLRSKNILQVHASNKETIKKCYTNEETAAANCPSEASLRNRTSAEILLFKTRDLEGNFIPKEYCPIDGNFAVTYRTNENGIKRECSNSDSSLNTCPLGSTLILQLKSCSFENTDLQFECLGQWEGPNGNTYLALADNRNSKALQYRCALYKENSATGIIDISLGRDSTCTNELYNSTFGFETFIFTPQNNNNWPPEVIYSPCSFPDWMIGKWEHATIQPDTFIFKDRINYKTYTIKCVGVLDSNDRYLVFTKNQCNEERYNCIRIQKKNKYIMEFQLGTNSSNNKESYESLCADNNFQRNEWIIQGRLDRKMEVSCPISGEYTGVIPDTTDICAKLWSDCRAPELMYYQVTDCTTAEIYEEREYKCLGHWREGEFLYTYTKRNDVAAETYECFVGTIISSNEDIYIKEAGEHCQKGINPLQYGMKLIKQGLYSCMGIIPSSTFSPVTKSLLPLIPSISSTKPWNIETPFPTLNEIETNDINSTSSPRPACVILFVIIFTHIIFLSY